jgi:hypothetical protein
MSLSLRIGYLRCTRGNAEEDQETSEVKSRWDYRTEVGGIGDERNPSDTSSSSHHLLSDVARLRSEDVHEQSFERQGHRASRNGPASAGQDRGRFQAALAVPELKR